MNLIEFFFGKPENIIITDEYFGNLNFYRSKKKSDLGRFEGEVFLKPLNKNIEIGIDGVITGITEEQRKLYQEIEKNYEQIIAIIAPELITEFSKWLPNFQIIDFNTEFILTYVSIPNTQKNKYLELCYETIHDKEHTVTITLKNFEVVQILIDG